MDYLSYKQFYKNKANHFIYKDKKHFSTQPQKETYEAQKPGIKKYNFWFHFTKNSKKTLDNLEENKIEKPFIFKSKFQNLDYVFPEDKNIKKFMLKGICYL